MDHRRTPPAAPRLVELCFQTAGLWGMAAEGPPGLPGRIDKVALPCSPGRKQGRLRGVADGNGYVRPSGYKKVMPAAAGV
jgi:hypothetical protein